MEQINQERIPDYLTFFLFQILRNKDISFGDVGNDGPIISSLFQASFLQKRAVTDTYTSKREREALPGEEPEYRALKNV
jgi:hypothetical protein